MDKFKIIFCFFLLIISSVYISDSLNNINLFNFLISSNKTSLAVSSSLNNKFNKENNEKIENVNSQEYKEKKPQVYFYNTHQTEEYKSNVYNITPTVVTASEMLKEELLEKNIYSIVEEKSIKKGLDKYDYDYSYSYRISLEYLKEKKEKFPSLIYYFDIHRDSIKGENSKTTIENKKYAKIMFLVGKNHEKYEENVKNIKIMEKYLNTNYPGILRDTYYQPLYSYNQEYDSNMFLVELGGVDNTLEEIYNSSVALAGAISYYMEEKNEK